MNCSYKIKHKFLDLCIFFSLILLLLYLTFHINASDFKYECFNSISTYRATVGTFFFITFNAFIYLQFDNKTVFRTCIITQFFLIYTIGTCSLYSTIIIYFPILVILITSSYFHKRLYSFSLIMFLICTFICTIVYIVSNIQNTSTITDSFSYTHLLFHTLISSIAILIITCIYFKDLNQTSTDIESTIYDNYNSQNHIANHTLFSSPKYKNKDYIYHNLPSIYVKPAACKKNINRSQSINFDLASQDIKSIYSLSISLKQNIMNIQQLSTELNTISSEIKTVINSVTVLFATIQRKSFMLNSIITNTKLDIEHSYENCQLLDDYLIQLDNLSTIITHLSNKAILEKAHSNMDSNAMNFITNEFCSYSRQIRHLLLKMQHISTDLNKNYHSCNSSLKESSNQLASHNLSINEIHKTIQTFNLSLNDLLNKVSCLNNIADISNLNTKRIVADSSELKNILSNL